MSRGGDYRILLVELDGGFLGYWLGFIGRGVRREIRSSGIDGTRRVPGPFHISYTYSQE